MPANIDFTILDKIKAPADPVEPPKAERKYKTITSIQNAPEAPPEPLGAIYNKLAMQEREAAARQMEVYRAHQEATKRGELLMCEITKGITRGEEPAWLLLKACEVIGGMTGDVLFHEQNRKNLIAIHGAGLLEPAPLDMELQEIRQRLTMLTRPELDNEPADNRARIERAIKAHKERAAYLEEQITKHGAQAARIAQEGF